MARSIAVTWNYLCPFARNAHEHLVAALRAGVDIDVTFLAFSLSESHVEPGETSVFADPSKASEMLSMQAGIVVRDRFPEAFLDAHLALFSARHDEAQDLRSEAVVAAALTRAGLDPEAVLDEVEKGWPLSVFEKEHVASVQDHEVFGVPTFIYEDRAAFVRIMTRPDGDATVACATIERVEDLLVCHPELNEFKYTRVAN
jgi:hypothetical protein